MNTILLFEELKVKDKKAYELLRDEGLAPRKFISLPVHSLVDKSLHQTCFTMLNYANFESRS